MRKTQMTYTVPYIVNPPGWNHTITCAPEMGSSFTGTYTEMYRQSSLSGVTGFQILFPLKISKVFTNAF